MCPHACVSVCWGLRTLVEAAPLSRIPTSSAVLVWALSGGDGSSLRVRSLMHEPDAKGERGRMSECHGHLGQVPSLEL